ncbi:MAG: hypothetical protein RML93_09940, partial [Anaerolineales bacterium]|nr:hypothetical protein [Anaerolineales bacterium]MDW8447597.1 hypothetical protein [Anaerolineales bacterium]
VGAGGVRGRGTRGTDRKLEVAGQFIIIGGKAGLNCLGTTAGVRRWARWRMGPGLQRNCRQLRYKNGAMGGW